MDTESTFSDWLGDADSLIDEIEGWLAEEPRTYTARSGKTYKVDTSKGDGYWCPRHGRGCYRGCDDRRWGKFGAAGVLFYHRESGTFLLNQRSKMIHFGGTWSTLGGAIDRDEEAFDGAMREVEEEIGMVPAPYWQLTAHESVTEGTEGDWTYTTFVVEVGERWTPEKGDWESMGNEWVSLSEMATLPLHPGFKDNVHELLKAMYLSGAFQR